MPGLITQNLPFQTISIKELHPSYGAEVIGADFQSMTDEQFQEIKAAMAKVPLSYQPTSTHHSHSISTVSLSSATPVYLTPNTSISLHASALSITCGVT
jgi:hypothetical protein